MSARTGAGRGVLEERVGCAEGVVREFRSGDGEGVVMSEEMRAHVGSMETCVAGLRGWDGILGTEMEV